MRASNYFDSKGFIKTPSAVASGDGNMLKSSSCEGMLGSEFVIIDDFKISAGGGKSELIISSIYIGSSESANQKVCTLVIGKRNITINKDGIVDLDIGRSFIV
ncbi:hypothetical protein BSPWISOXPB_9237 [uncultured Gammaproteobacteria bacterium]|nr:hypothetical protein BSPWISOXPB_9237 [uncultured Gammaproteobacteria bacterium]